MKNIAEKYAGIFGLYLLLACWTPVFWFVSSARARHNMDMFEWSRLGWFEILFGLALVLGSFFSQFLLFFVKLEKE